jgi:hypothetical protein
MKKLSHIVVIILLISSCLNGYSQHFEWAASGSNILAGYTESCVTPDGRLIAAGQYEAPSYHISTDPVALFDGAGNEQKLKEYGNYFFVGSFNSIGQLEWTIDGTEFGNSTVLLGVAPLSDGRVVVAFRGFNGRYPLASKFDAYDVQNGTQTKLENNENEDDEYSNNKSLNGYDFFAIVSAQGNIQEVHAIRFKIHDDWTSFKACPDGGFVFTMADDEKVDDGKGKMVNRAHLYITKITRDYKIDWTYKLRFLDNSCCTYHQFPIIADVGINGDIYFSGNYRIGIRPDQAKDHSAPLVEPNVQYKEPYETVIGCLSPEGKLKWTSYSEGKSLVSTIHASGNQLLIGGNIQLQKTMFGLKIDTTEQKKAFLASFNFNGKPKWIKTFNASSINAISSDDSGNMFASFESKRSVGVKPLKIGTDTISNTFVRVVVASFDEQGNYRWYKMSQAMMSNEPHTKLHNDPCGNLYITGEMWYVLPVNMSLFDGAIVRGRGYGGAPLAARIRTTIPDNLLALNVSLQQSIKFHDKEKKDKVVAGSKVKRESNGQDSVQNNNALTDSIASGRGLTCVPIPYPWTIELRPNPTKGAFKIRAKISYTDNQVSCELWNVKGTFIKVLSPPQLREFGGFDIEADISDLSSGIYLIVLKGSGSAVTSKLVLSK